MICGSRNTASATSLCLLLCLCGAWIVHISDAARPEPASGSVGSIGLDGPHKPPKKFQFKSPRGFFIQERASKQLPGPGQHFSFGALVPWEQIHAFLDTNPSSKLLLLVRHGEALSNYLGDALGPDEWFKWEGKCAYIDENNTSFGIFDADLTELGVNEAKSLNGMLDNSGWFKKLTAGRNASALVSPLTRCLHSAGIILDGLPLTSTQVEENIRETLGEDTCDARKSVSDPDPQEPGRLEGPCDFDQGLRTLYPQYKFPIVDEYQRELRRQGAVTKRDRPADKPSGLGFGMLSDKDLMWTKEREGQKHQVKRAVNFLADVFLYVQERVVVVVTHSGTVRSLLLAAGREPYRPQNTELVPLVVDEIRPYNAEFEVEE